MSEHVSNALKAFKEFATETTPEKRETIAVVIINNILNDLQGHGAYNVLASAIAGFTAVQQVPWKSLSAIIQGCLMGWDTLAAYVAEQSANQSEADHAVKH